MKSKIMKFMELVDKIREIGDLKYISEFNIPLDTAINVMKKYVKKKACILDNIFDNLAKHGGYLVSTNLLSASEITQASACGEVYVNDDGLCFARVGKLPDSI